MECNGAITESRSKKLGAIWREQAKCRIEFLLVYIAAVEQWSFYVELELFRTSCTVQKHLLNGSICLKTVAL